ncbi:MAG: hypothetical protein AAF443_08575, partial [Chlamydiota bacterium]
ALQWIARMDHWKHTSCQEFRNLVKEETEGNCCTTWVSIVKTQVVWYSCSSKIFFSRLLKS